MPAPLLNQHNRRPAEVVAKEFLHMRCRAADKKKWTAAAKRARWVLNSYGRPTTKLAAWAVAVLNAAAERELGPQGRRSA